MKLVFSTQNVARTSFIDLCRYAYDYGYSGFEIYDAVKERKRTGATNVVGFNMIYLAS